MIAGPPEEVRSILAVCTGNVCRSPVAAAYLSAGLGRHGVDVSSAGLHALIGEPVDPMIGGLLDLPIAGFAARQLVPELVRAADLLLVMTRDHRRAVVGAVPAAVRRTFTLLEFADLVEVAHLDGALTGSAARNLALVVAGAPGFRARRPADRADDIDDPRGRLRAVHQRAEAEIRVATLTVTAAVTSAALDGQDGVVAEERAPTRLGDFSRDSNGESRS